MLFLVFLLVQSHKLELEFQPKNARMNTGVLSVVLNGMDVNLDKYNGVSSGTPVVANGNLTNGAGEGRNLHTSQSTASTRSLTGSLGPATPTAATPATPVASNTPSLTPTGSASSLPASQQSTPTARPTRTAPSRPPAPRKTDSPTANTVTTNG